MDCDNDLCARLWRIADSAWAEMRLFSGTAQWQVWGEEILQSWKSSFYSLTLGSLFVTAPVWGLCLRTERVTRWGIGMLWQSFNLVHTLCIDPHKPEWLLLHSWLHSVIQGLPLSPVSGGCRGLKRARGGVSHAQTSGSGGAGLTHRHQPCPSFLPRQTALTPFFLPSFPTSLFPLMSCNTDNEPDDLPLIRLSLACLVIDP